MKFPDGTTVTVEDYYEKPNPPKLVSGDGAEVSGDMVTQLTSAGAPGTDATPSNPFGFVQPVAETAEATATAEPKGGMLAANPNVIAGTDGEPIGNVQKLSGEVFAIRVDGTRVKLELGDQVFQGDILESGPEGAVGILLADETTFSMGNNGRMVLDEMIYDPQTQQGSVSMSVLQGVFTFVSGQVAKTDPDAMTLDTPVATIGIRGTQIGLEIPDGENLNVVLMEEADGFVGEVYVINDGGVRVMNGAFDFTTVRSFDQQPAEVVTIDTGDVVQRYASPLSHLPTTNSSGEATSGNTMGLQNDGDQGQKDIQDLNNFDTAAGGQQQVDTGTVRVTGGVQTLNIIDQVKADNTDINPYVNEGQTTTGTTVVETQVVEEIEAAPTTPTTPTEPPGPVSAQELADRGLENVTYNASTNTYTGTVDEDFDGSDLDVGFNLTGSEGDNVITTGNYTDTVTGSGGQDTIATGGGDDTLFGGGGDDVLSGGEGNN